MKKLHSSKTISPNHSEPLLKVSMGTQPNHNATALKVRKALASNHNETALQINISTLTWDGCFEMSNCHYFEGRCSRDSTDRTRDSTL